MITAKTEIIGLPDTENCHFCASCGKKINKHIRIEHGMGIVSPKILRLCIECSNTLANELVRELR